MSEVKQYVSRTIDFEPDTIAIIPDSANYVVIGTYSLCSQDVQIDKTDAPVDGESSEQQRHGSLQVLPYQPSPADISTSATQPLAIHTFPRCGIYSVHFHPQRSSILGVAASDARIYFFKVSVSSPGEAECPSFQLTLLGSVLIEDPTENDDRVAIITQFQFLDLSVSSSNSAASRIALVATSQFGNTKSVVVDLSDALITGGSPEEIQMIPLPYQIHQIHQQAYGMEAWAILSLPLPLTTPSTITLPQMVLSGGDDSQLIISACTTSPDNEINIRPILTDRRTHNAGIVSITSLGNLCSQSPETTSSTSPATALLIATGSYDEQLRIFALDPASPRPKLDLLAVMHLPGGVWRITLLDQYAGLDDSRTDYIMLVAGHTAGAFIVRLTVVVSQDEQHAARWRCELKEEARFTAGHRSLVYACVARRKEGTSARVWEVLSSSFYDLRLCNWEWVDAGPPPHLEAEQNIQMEETRL